MSETGKVDLRCQMTMSDDSGWRTTSWLCDKPAKAWIPDTLGRSGWGGRQLLCGLHARAHDRVASRVGRPLSKPI